MVFVAFVNFTRHSWQCMQFADIMACCNAICHFYDTLSQQLHTLQTAFLTPVTGVLDEVASPSPTKEKLFLVSSSQKTYVSLDMVPPQGN